MLNLGEPTQELERVYGGFHHKMWRLQTDQAIYAVKQLSPDTDINSPQIIDHYNVTETAAEIFSRHGIKAVHAIRNESVYLHVLDQTGYLVYPWSEAVVLDKSQLKEQHAEKIAAVLASMHQANIEVAGMKEARFDILAEDELIETINRARANKIDSAELLRDELPDFLGIIHDQKSAVHLLEKHVVVSHGDLDQKNALWDENGDPVLIDWESAHKLNPTFEIVLAALDWSNITSGFDARQFGNILSAYKQAGGVIESEALQAAYDCILGDWVFWLVYNVARAVDELDPELRPLGEEQIALILPTIRRLRKLRPELRARAGLGVS